MKNQAKQLLVISRMILEVIPASGVPNGHIYAGVMSGLSLYQYQSIIAGLKKLKAITENNFYFERGTNYESAIKNLTLLTKE